MKAAAQNKKETGAAKGIDTGNRCNNNCLMCTQLRPSYCKSKVEQKVHSMEDVKRQVREAAKDDAIVFTGGEPTIRKDLFELIEFVKENYPKKRICLLTNGRMLSYKDYGKELEKIGLDEIIIPLHGHNSALHDFVTQTKGSFEQTVQGIKNLRESGLTREIRIVVHKVNYVYLPEIASFIATNFPFVDRIVFLYFDAIGSGAVNKKRLLVPMKEVAPFLEKAFNELGVLGEKAAIYHFPQCILPEGVRKKVYGKTVEMRRICFAKECGQCVYFEKCPGIWKSYKGNFGLGEFEKVNA